MPAPRQAEAARLKREAEAARRKALEARASAALPTIPSQGQTLPVPDTAPPPVPSSALEGLVEPGERSPAFAGLAKQQSWRDMVEQVLQQGRMIGLTQSMYAGVPYHAPVGQRAPVGTQNLTTEADLPAGEQATGFDAALAEARKRAQEFSDPMNTIEAAAGHVMVSFENNYSPPFIMYEVQAHWGWSDAAMKAAGYVRGLGGWKLDLGGEDTATTAAGAGGGGAGATASWSFPSIGGGSRNSFASSSLINWRI